MPEQQMENWLFIATAVNTIFQLDGRYLHTRHGLLF